MNAAAPALVRTVSRDGEHRFSKQPCGAITLLAGLGVEGDAHAGVTVQHRSRVARDPSQPNLRQVHLIGTEFFALAAAAGHEVTAGQLGENVLTEGLDLLGLPTGTLLRLGPVAVVRLTGLRNPCAQIDTFQQGLLKVAASRDADGAILRRAGVMSVVVTGGVVSDGDSIGVELPALPHAAMDMV